MLKAVVAATMLFLGAGGAQAAVTEVDIGINPTFAQTGPTTLVSSGGFFSGRAFVESPGDYPQDSGRLDTPNADNLPMDFISDGTFNYFNYGDSSPSLDGLRAIYPTGAYTFHVGEGDAAASYAIDYRMEGNAVQVPALTAGSFQALQGLNAADGLAIDFLADLGNTNPDVNENNIFFNILDSGNANVFAAALTSDRTSVFLPANTLLAGQSYTFDLLFDDRISAPAGDPGTVATTIFFDTHTYGAFRTAAATAAVPEPTSWAMLIGGMGLIGGTLRRRRADPRALAA